MSSSPNTLPDGTELRDFLDYDTTRKNIYDGTIGAINTAYPIENDRFRLSIDNPRYEGPETFSLEEQKKAILQRRNLHRRLVGTWKLFDKAENKVVDQKKTVLAHVPFMTQRGTFIIHGNEYTIANQMRLKNGVFSRRKESGELESHFNVLKGGPSFRIFMEPKTGVFRMHIGQADLKLYPILKAIGVNDTQMREAWGPEITTANTLESDDPRTVRKAYERLAGYRAKKGEGEEVNKHFAELLHGMTLDPKSTQRTLGKAFGNVTPEVMLRSSQKLINIGKGTEDTDDRDSLSYQAIMSPEDFFKERILKDSGRVGSAALWKATLRGNLSGIKFGALDPHINSVFYKSGLAQPLEEINTVDPVDQNLRVVRIGEGGISEEAVPVESRNVQPSYFGFIDPVRSPESGSVGVDSRFAHGVKKGSDGNIYTQMFNARTKKQDYVKAEDVSDKVIAFPGEIERAKKEGRAQVKVMAGGKLQFADPSKVDYIVPSASNMFTIGSNIVPMISAIKAGRLLMGAKMANQALALQNPEAPLVQALTPDGTDSFENQLGRLSAVVRSEQPGIVQKVDKGSVTVKQQDGTDRSYELYHNFPFNRKTLLTNTPTVKPGDVVRAGGLLAHSNFTDKAGTLAVGTNLRVGYLPYKGENYEDAYVISASAAKKLTSEHMYTEKADVGDNMAVSRNKYLSIYPSVYTKDQLDKVDNNGVVKPGTTLNYGDPIILSVERRAQKGAGQLHRASGTTWIDSAVEWKHHFPGQITDVFSDDDGIKVAVKGYAPAEVGDKMSGRYGDKGVIGAVVPDDQMPHTQDGQPLDVLQNPLGVISRVNPAQMFEAVLGKIARQRGRGYRVPSFSDESFIDFVKKEMQAHNVKDTEAIVDPGDSNRVIPNVLVGDRFYMKLHHTAESKGSGRALGSYTSEGEPAGGFDEENPKRVGFGEMSALISHGAVENIRDIKTIRGQRNEAYWRAMIQGFPPPTPDIPLAYKKFLYMLKASGINVNKHGDLLNLSAMTDKEATHMSHGEVTKPSTVKWLAQFGREAFGEKSLDPVEGGLFDRGITGGHGGHNWSHITLHEPLPQPVMEDSIRRLLGLTQKSFEGVLSGTQDIPGIGTGPQAMQEALGRISVPQEIETQKQIFKEAESASRRDDACKKLKILSGLAKQKVTPKELMISKVPVLPPIFRPITATENFDMVAGVNELYMDLLEANNNLKEVSGLLQGEPVGAARLNTYNSLKAVVGLGDPVKPERKTRMVRGLLADVFGTSPKLGLFQQKLLGASTELSGRAAITPNPQLDMDHIGIPVEQAWQLYSPFVARRLARAMGDSPTAKAQAVKLVADHSKQALEMLQEEMKDRPVMATRAPALHRYSLMAFYPVLTNDKTLQLSPAITPGFNADFDGDAMNFHVVVSEKAIKEAKEKLLPSRNLRSPADFKVNWAPRQEFLAGLYLASHEKDNNKPPRVYNTRKEMIEAFHRGELAVDAPVVIKEEK